MIRRRILQVGFVTCLLVVSGRLAYVQAHDTTLYKRLNKLAKAEWNASNVIHPVRGAIYDSLGGVLAYSAPAYTMDIDLRAIRRNHATLAVARDLSSILKVSQPALLAQLRRSGVVWLQMYPYLVRVPLSTEQQVLAAFNKLGLQNDISSYKSYSRFYPNGSFASDVLGFTNSHGAGVSGIESEYNRYLAGRAGLRAFVQDPTGHAIPFHPIHQIPVHNGDNVYLTLNPVIQRYAEQSLATVQKRFKPTHAAIIVANPQTGAILALATLPSFNPNQYWSYPASTLFNNWAISDPFEPGSTFKPEVLVGALATHSIRLRQTYMSGVVNVNGVAIHDWNLYGWGRLNFEQAIIYSSNVGMVHIGQAEGVKNFYTYLRRFGFTHPTGIALPGEANSIVFPEKNLNPVDFATMAFGQGLAITPIQQVAAMGAIANGGDLLRPYLVQKIVSPSGKVVYSHKVQVVRQVAPRSVMKKVTSVMVKTVSQDPQGATGVIQGYNIAGKTGTAEIPKPGGGYYANLYNLSFIGFVPASHPRLEIYVTVNEPHHTAQWGDWVATPAARYVLKRALAYLNIAPHASKSTPPPAPANTRYTPVPSVAGQALPTAESTLLKAGLRVNIVGGRTGPVVGEWPNSGTTLAAGSSVTLAVRPRSSKVASVPNLRGMTMAEAMRVCAILGIQLAPQGQGFAAIQSVAPGKKVAVGTRLSVKFQPLA